MLKAAKDTKTLCSYALILAYRDAGEGNNALGVKEVPRWSNRGPRVDVYLKTAGEPLEQPYCCSAVYTWFEEAANLHGVHNPLTQTGYCPTMADFLKSKKLVRKRNTDAMPGDVILFWIAREGRYGHAGIVFKNLGDGRLVTVEANTLGTGMSVDAAHANDGDGVYVKTRVVAGTHHLVGNMQDFLVVNVALKVPVLVDPNVTQVMDTGSFPGAYYPVKVTVDGVPSDIPAFSHKDRTYVGIAAYAEAFNGKHLSHGVFDGHTSTLNLVTE